MAALVVRIRWLYIFPHCEYPQENLYSLFVVFDLFIYKKKYRDTWKDNIQDNIGHFWLIEDPLAKSCIHDGLSCISMFLLKKFI